MDRGREAPGLESIDGGTAVATVARHTASRDGGDHAGLGVDAPHAMILLVGDEQVQAIVAVEPVTPGLGVVGGRTEAGGFQHLLQYRVGDIR
mgnify:CR=1 FL=1